MEDIRKIWYDKEFIEFDVSEPYSILGLGGEAVTLNDVRVFGVVFTDENILKIRYNYKTHDFSLNQNSGESYHIPHE